MKKFIRLSSPCLSIPEKNINTDQIIPARFLKTIKRDGLGKYLFYDWRFDKNGRPKTKNPFDKSIYRKAKILVTGNNFGCGSSREHAVWVLLDFGFKVIISSSFGDIFYNNALKNGLLPVILSNTELNKLFQTIGKRPETKVIINLEKQKLAIEDKSLSFNFPIDQFRKACLINGMDELGYIFSQKERIKKFEKKHKIYIDSR